MTRPGNEQGQAVTGCCLNPNLLWTLSALPEPIIVCAHCGFRIDPEGLLLDWLNLEEIEAARMVEENTPYILELAARLGLH